ncbi:RPN8 [Hepatospora eriocheir]|uniref:RPN8 n=1 Tax=Hepatospora eriocheir TaxID=1081669 RepID=A0A1X0QFM7_9MICR|nr:RPN8 [Hepatospora eriocheir]
MIKVESISISPLVLLSVVDHYKRQSYPRVLGILLGINKGDKIEVTNSFAFPFEEKEDEFHIETSYLFNMYRLFHKVNNKEKIVGWYHSGSELHRNDLEITKSLAKIYNVENMVLCVVKINEQDTVPVQTYYFDGIEHKLIKKILVGADENEEIGVEHLLRDIKTTTGTTPKDKLMSIKNSLKKFKNSLDNVIAYLDSENHNSNIINLIQETINLFPKTSFNVDMDRIYNAEFMNLIVAMNNLQKNKFN